MLFDRNIEPRCVYCRHGSVLGYGKVACKRRGIMSAEGSCGAFRYEPTKRIPEIPHELDASNLTKEDFSIEP